MGLFYLQISRHSLQKSMELNTYGEERKSTWLPLHSVCRMETIPPGLGPEPSYTIANSTLPKALPGQSCWFQTLQGHSFKRTTPLCCAGLGNLPSHLLGDLKKPHCSPEWKNTRVFADRLKCFIWNWNFFKMFYSKFWHWIWNTQHEQSSLNVKSKCFVQEWSKHDICLLKVELMPPSLLLLANEIL